MSDAAALTLMWRREARNERQKKGQIKGTGKEYMRRKRRR